MKSLFVAFLVATGALANVPDGTPTGEGKVKITREDSQPRLVEVVAGDEVRFINTSGQTVHIWFGGRDAPRLHLSAGREGARVKFETAGTYRYTAQVSGDTTPHTGSVVVK